MPDDPIDHDVASAAASADAEALSLPLDPRVAASMHKWLAVATVPASADTRLFAKLIAARDARTELALLGLQPDEWRTLVARHFAHAKMQAAPPASQLSVNTAAHADFLRTLHALLLTHTSPEVDPADAHCVATIITHACLRPDHLWRDLGLAGRDEVTWMLTRYFPTLVALNVANLRWKKFLAAQRALATGTQPGPAPGCPGCEDFAHCFPQQG